MEEVKRSGTGQIIKERIQETHDIEAGTRVRVIVGLFVLVNGEGSVDRRWRSRAFEVDLEQVDGSRSSSSEGGQHGVRSDSSRDSDSPEPDPERGSSKVMGRSGYFAPFAVSVT